MLMRLLPRYVSLYTLFSLSGIYTQALNIVSKCNSSIYCTGELLQTIQLSKIFNDSKTFVDLHLLHPQAKVLVSFNKLMANTDNNPSHYQLMTFLYQNFESKAELLAWRPSDFKPNPPFLNKINNPELRQFARDVNNIWPELGRKVDPDIALNPDRYSFTYVPKGFIVPGGRFKELYYWDSYWIIRGLLMCDMKKTARGMIENFFHLVNKFGYVPNGSRVYYLGRSQPPLLTYMVYDFFTETGNILWLQHNIATVERELWYWLKKKTTIVEMGNDKYELLRYVSDKSNKGPRPEAYYEDFKNSETLPLPKREKFYIQVKSAAESGWDFSSRWFVTPGRNPKFNMTDINISHVIPVDLNAIFAGALQRMGDLKNRLEGPRTAKVWWKLAERWRRAIENVLWEPEDGAWFDYDTDTQSRRRHFYLSCAAPLWTGAIQPWQASDRAKYFVKYLRSTGALEFPGGVPTSLRHTGQQWDYPNAWPPLQAMLIGALENSNNVEAKRIAKHLAKTWILVNYTGYKKYQKMFEKYSCSNPGEHGGGGEYEVQTGFGWTNGYIIELFGKYGNDTRLK